ncbi:Alpha/Beta hydrolase protein [Bombardia bombarda]|uniref:Carboxypeptidase n=1 Tax=Bombardia bombarda TaxID=252184 RepID=A0AA39WUX1_9PEZI|nr:Alpha/Beta hydrolase protein [Bombardia bombarda]
MVLSLSIIRTAVLSALFLGLSTTVEAGFPPKAEQLLTAKSDKFAGVSISYKQTHICETTPGVRSFSGYVNLPANPAAGRNFEIHTFFWFFEARNDPANAPLSLWLQGGPGAPSAVSAAGENGPCIVARDSKSTTLNPWSWNDKVNMLYVDQPVQVGFSYDSLVNGTINEILSPFVVDNKDPAAAGALQSNLTLLAGTFASQNPVKTTNTTLGAAVAMWEFMQAWMQEFPEYNSTTNHISIWSESYGGQYGPTFADFFEKKNDLIAAGDIGAPAVQIHIDTVGIINGFIDPFLHITSYPNFAINNTYGIKAINETQYSDAISNTDSCRNLIGICRDIADRQDPTGLGNDTQVNKACFDAVQFCMGKLWLPYSTSGRNVFDITSPVLSSFPPKWAAGYFNTPEVQQAIGVPLNFTGFSAVVSQVFDLTGDIVRGHSLEALATLLDRGIKVALIYGDRDYQVNWLGGEQVSLAIDSQNVPAANFRSAGYAAIETNPSYNGGFVRQYGNLSFSRVFQAGHAVPYYQPETAYQIFNRVMSNTDVATGKLSTIAGDYSSSGPDSVFVANSIVPKEEARDCYLWDVMETCDQKQEEILTSGSAVVKDFILVGYQLANGTEVLYGDNGTDAGGSLGNSTMVGLPPVSNNTNGGDKTDQPTSAGVSGREGTLSALSWCMALVAVFTVAHVQDWSF